MKLLQSLIILFSLTICINSFSQEIEITQLIVELKPVTTIATANITATRVIKTGLPLPIFPVSAWQSKNTVGFDLNQIAFVNWNAGGVSSISGLLKGNFTRIHTAEKSKWINELIFRYGINKQDGLAIRKSDDEFRFNSTFGYRKEI
jgi:hypothetical protein